MQREKQRRLEEELRKKKEEEEKLVHDKEKEAEELRLERLKKEKKERDKGVSFVDDAKNTQDVKASLAAAKSAMSLAQATMRMTEKELDRLAKESLKVVSNKSMAYELWLPLTKKIRDLQYHEDLVDIISVEKGGKTFPHVESKIQQVVPHGRSVYLKMAHPDDRLKLVEILKPHLLKFEIHLMTPSAESGEMMRSPSRAMYKMLTTGLSRGDIKGNCFTSGPSDVSAPPWSISFKNEVVARCDTEAYAAAGGEIVSRIRLLKMMKLGTRPVDLEEIIKGVKEGVKRYAPSYPFPLFFVTCNGPLEVAVGKGKGKGK